jgi:hypothetical protein
MVRRAKIQNECPRCAALKIVDFTGRSSWLDSGEGPELWVHQRADGRGPLGFEVARAALHRKWATVMRAFGTGLAALPTR